MLFSIIFADDTNMFVQGIGIRELETMSCINIELCKVVTWLNVKKLSLNVYKKPLYGKKHRNRINTILAHK